MILTNKNSNTINISNAREISGGGEGKIYEHPFNTDKVLKIYHQPRPASFEQHLKKLSCLGDWFVKPETVWFTTAGKVAGFEMDFVDFNAFHLFNNLFNKGFCNTIGIDYGFKINVLKKLRTALEDTHLKGIVIGDLNQYNLFFSSKGDILFVDTDSYATTTQPHNGVLLDEIRDWTTVNINQQTDSWAFDILAFWTITFMHPFQWVVVGNTETLEQRVISKKSVLKSIPGIKIPKLYQPPAGIVLKQFEEIFDGRRYMIDFNNAPVAVSAVIKQSVASANLTIRELQTGITDMYCTGNFISVKANGEWKYMDARRKGQVSVSTEVFNSDEILYLSNSYGNYCTRIGDSVFSMTDKEYKFFKPVFYFRSGYLTVFECGKDIQWNFNINNQIAGNLDYTNTPVFTKSIIVRGAPIQNFGGKRYLNLPLYNRYVLCEVPIDTKNAQCTLEYAAVEFKQKSRVHYIIGSLASGIISVQKQHIELDFLPEFASCGDNVFVPEDGRINVYNKFNLLIQMDAPMCTRSSRLHHTSAGILLLESGILYLLNTK